MKLRSLFNCLVSLALVGSTLSAPALAGSGRSTATIPDHLADPPSQEPPELQKVDYLSLPPASQPPPQPGPELRLAAGVFDPVLEPASDLLPQGLTLDAYPTGVEGYYIVQFDGPILPEWKVALEKTGARIFDYIPDFGFVVKMGAQTRAVAEELPHVRWVGLYQPGFRLEPSLFGGVLPAEAAPGQLIVVVFPGEDLSAIVKQLEALGGEVLETTQSHWKSKVKLAINPARAARIAAINGVRWVEPVAVFELANNKAADIIGVRPVWENHGLYGAGQIVAVCDTGLDQGLTSPASLHDDFEDGSGNSRVIALYDLVGGGDGAEDNDGHGTHVAGSVLGNGDLSGAFPVTHTFPTTSYVGMAPDARLVFQAVEDDSGYLTGIPVDLNTLFAQAHNDGARIHSNSWGGGIFGSYSSYSQDVDEFVWDYPGFLPLFAASNDGVDANDDGVIDLNSVTPPGTAKNCVTVGATENDRPSGSTPTPGYNFPWGTGSWAYYYPSDPVNSDHVSDDPDGMAAFSSRGPTLDGRTKPDVIAPGTNVASVRSLESGAGTGWGVVTGNSNYLWMGGTSMATPLAAGATALIREWYTRTQALTPSAALMKATLVNGAFDIYPGQYGSGATQEITPTAPNNVEGWGRVDIQASIFPTAPRRFQYVDDQTGLSTNGIHTYTFEVVTDSVPLRANLVWSDYPGTTAAAGGLVNDLDLTLYGPGGTTFYPTNGIQRGASQHLYYDDWGAESYSSWSGTDGEFAVRFTLDKALFYVLRTSSGSVDFGVRVYDDDGGGGNPGTILRSLTTTFRGYAPIGPGLFFNWHVVDIDPVTINDGDFYVSFRQLTAFDPSLLYDTSYPSNRSYNFNGVSWSLQSARDYMIQALVHTDTGATDYDRVNNVVGIHVPTTTLQTGHYTLTVRGYNVPQGPQPYALTLNGGLPALLEVGQVATPDPVEPDAPLTYTVRITNTGIATATQVVLTETYDGNAIYQSAIPTPSSGNNVWDLGDIGGGQVELVTVTVRTDSGLATGDLLTNVVTLDSIQTEPRAITVTTPLLVRPKPTWDKQVYVNDVLTDTFPATVVASDTLRIVDRVRITYSEAVTFTLVETWTNSLELVLPVTSTVGTVTPGVNTLTWEATGVTTDTWHVLTRTFHVTGSGWLYEYITGTLWVENADRQRDDRVLQFRHPIPNIEVSPATLAAAQYPNQANDLTLIISNTGDADLTWNLGENPAVDWLGETPISDTLAPSEHTSVTVTFDSRGLSPNIYTTTLDIANNDPYEPLMTVLVTLTVLPPTPNWDKQVYVNDVPAGPSPITVSSDATIKIVDQVTISYTGNITFTLVENWTESLQLLGDSVVALPDGTVNFPGSEVITSTAALTWTITNLPSDWSYVITKTFSVISGPWDTDYITESLYVEGAATQLNDVVLEFQHAGSKIFLPLMLKN
jgi:uncharacterized repeat protein (TIGR01451 family)